MQEPMPLMSTSVTSPLLRKARLLLLSSCMLKEYPHIVEDQGVGCVKLHVCLQETHMDRVGFKVATIILKSNPSSITVLTMNGSPHCIQLHFLVEQARQLTSYTGPVRHVVVEKGEVYEVSSEAVKVARHLASVEQFLARRARGSGC